MSGITIGCRCAYNKKWYVCFVFIIIYFISIDLLTKLFVLAYAGMAMATGQYLEIPIVFCSLVTSLFFITKANLSVPFDSAFIMLLKVGTGDKEFGRIVKKYAYNWWDKSQQLENSQLLHPEILDTCFNFHKEQLLKLNEPRKHVSHQPIEVTVSFQILDIGAKESAEEKAEGGAKF